MIKNLTEKVNKIYELPRIKRIEVQNILKECYKQGIVDARLKMKKLIQKYEKENNPIA